MPDGLYDRDILEWSERQSALLRRIARGERLNESVDWPNVAEEIEAVGRSELRACESLLRKAMEHLLKLHAAPGDNAAQHWRGEIRAFLFRARRAFSPSMQQRLDLQDLYGWALIELHAEPSNTPPAIPERCPWTLDDLLADRTDVPTLLARLP